MNKAYLLIGGNTGDRKVHLTKAAEAIGQTAGRILKQSGWYETAAWGKTDQPAFLNQCLLVETPLTAIELLEELLAIETRLGRIRTEKYGPRTIDIDILLFNRMVYRSAELSVPHPELAHRRFALVPLKEIAPRYLHPVRQKTIARLLLDCKDPLPVKKLS
jgi:2-amino-4-hydroxy-6-hydroxymethyldihydropteridine diphosphokinase